MNTVNENRGTRAWFIALALLTFDAFELARATDDAYVRAHDVREHITRLLQANVYQTDLPNGAAGKNDSSRSAPSVEAIDEPSVGREFADDERSPRAVLEASSFTRIVFWTLVIGGLLFFLLPYFSGTRSARGSPRPAQTSPPRDTSVANSASAKPDETLAPVATSDVVRRARRLCERGMVAEAVRELLLAALVLLERRGALTVSCATSREAAIETVGSPAIHEALSPLVVAVEQTQFRGRELPANDVEDRIDNFEALVALLSDMGEERETDAVRSQG